jgi:hypothetical protein
VTANDPARTMLVYRLVQTVPALQARLYQLIWRGGQDSSSTPSSPAAPAPAMPNYAHACAPTPSPTPYALPSPPGSNRASTAPSPTNARRP